MATSSQSNTFSSISVTNIRNICVLAHVDHGKTCFSDYLIASNGLFSSRQAGKLRYLDSREDEQQRHITMKSSSIALSYRQNDHYYLINLIDSPGHVDFLNEVSTAVRLSDSALILVDSVEGICVQTKAVVQNAFKEGLFPILVLNKIDRLIFELKLSPFEAYLHLTQIIEKLNEFCDSLSVLSSLSFPHNIELNYQFSPQKNIIFASSFDGWAFKLSDFAKLYSSRLSIPPEGILPYLWGSYYYHSKSKSISSDPTKSPPLIISLVLQPLWHIYSVVLIEKNIEKLTKILSTLSISLPARELKVKSDDRIRLQSIMSRWLPLSENVLDIVVSLLPSPLQSQHIRLPLILPSYSSSSSISSFTSFTEETPLIIFLAKLNYWENYTSSTSQIVYPKPVSETETNIINNKTDEIPLKELSKDLTDNSSQYPGNSQSPVSSQFYGFARIFSGTLKPDQKVFIIRPGHDSIPVVISPLCLMGPKATPIDSAKMGHIIGVSCS